MLLQENKDPEVAFTIVIRNEGGQEPGGPQALGEAAVDITHEAVNEAVQGAVQDVSRRDTGHIFVSLWH